jgi:dethiobiotin synthetase
MNTGLFITGTDTGVGKTFITCGIARLLHQWGAKVAVMKPIATGNRRDAELLIKAFSFGEAMEIVNPQFFRAPLAPRVAASLERRVVDLDAIYRAFWYLHKKYEVLIVEGIGGVKVPIGESTYVTDLIQALRLPALVVARAGLGTLNHTLLTLESLERAKVPVAGVLLNGGMRKTPAEKTNLEALQECTVMDILGELPRLKKSDAVSVSRALARMPRFIQAVKKACRVA